MERPVKTYDENLAIRGIHKQMTSRFKDLYITNTRPKTDFLETDEESRILKLGKFIPGKIYTFQYDPLYKNILDFYDKRPIIICNNSFFAGGTKNDILTGININFLPETIRIYLLDKFYELFEATMQVNYDMAGENKINMDIANIVRFFKDWHQVLKYFTSAKGIGYQFAYRHYIIDRIKNLRYIEYQHWEMLPFLITEEFEKLSVNQIYTLYWQTLSGNIKKAKNK